MNQDGDNGEGHIEALDESEELTEDDIVTLEDDEGNSERFVILAIVEVQDEDYALLAPEAQIVEDDEDYEVFVYEYREGPDGTHHFKALEDEARFTEVVAFAQTLFESSADD